jgi:hypothetical protein
VVLVPADLIGTGVVVDVTQLPGVRVLLPERPTEFLGGDVEWMPDGSAIVSEVGSFTAGASSHIDVVTVADGERRTLIGDGSGPVVSPDGSQIAYSRGDGQGLDEIWVAASDGSNPRRVALSLTGPVWSPDGSLLLAEDSQGEFTVRPDGTDRTTLGIRDHTPTFALLWADSSGIDWQPVGSDEQ